MLEVIINIIKNLFISKGEKPTESIVTGNDIAKALGHMDEDGEFILSKDKHVRFIYL